MATVFHYATILAREKNTIQLSLQMEWNSIGIIQFNDDIEKYRLANATKNSKHIPCINEMYIYSHGIKSIIPIFVKRIQCNDVK